MLPKVATHFLHSTTRSAAAAVQNQTTLRNVLQLHPSNPSTTSPAAAGANGLVASSSTSVISATSSSNNRGSSNGPSGSSKKSNAGSRFYTGYNSAARAVTQANSLTSQDAPATQLEESIDEVNPAARRALLKASATPQKRTRLRSSSVTTSLPTSREKDKSTAPVGVLKTVQLQARSLHALAPVQQEQSSRVQETAPPPLVEAQQPPASAPSPRMARRNSTSSATSRPSSPLLPDSGEVPLPESPALSAGRSSASATTDGELSSSSLESETSSATSAPPSSPTKLQRRPLTEHGEKIRAAFRIRDALAVADAVRSLTSLPLDAKPTTADFNLAIDALSSTRAEGEPLTTILDVYNTMLARSMHPNFRTYTLLIDLFAKRDWEVHRMIVLHQTYAKEKQHRQQAGLELRTGFESEGLPTRIEELKKENNFTSAMKLFEAVVSVGSSERLDFSTFKALIRSCSLHSNVKAALTVFGHLEQRTDCTPDADVYRYLLQAFVNKGDWKGAEIVFEGFRQKSREGKIFWDASHDATFKRMRVQVWNQMIEMYFRKNEPEKAVEMLDLMLQANAEENHQSSFAAAAPSSADPNSDVPAPASSTFTTIIGGFIHLKDVSTALAWFNRLLEQPDGPPEDPFTAAALGRPMRPDKVAWTLMFDALATEGRVEDLNKLFTSFLKAAEARPTPGMERTKSSDTYRRIVFVANLEALNTAKGLDRDAALARLDYLRDAVLPKTDGWDFEKRQMTEGLAEQYTKLGAFESAFGVLNEFVLRQLQSMDQQAPNTSTGIIHELQNMVLAFWDRVYNVLSINGGQKYQLPYAVAIDLTRLATEVLGLKVAPEQALWLLHSYAQAKEQGGIQEFVPFEAWRALLLSAVHVEGAGSAVSAAQIRNYAFRGLASLLEDMAARNIPFDDALCEAGVRAAAVDLVCRGRDAEWCRALFTRLGDSYLQAYDERVGLQYEALRERLEEEVPAVQPAQVERINMMTPPPMSKSYGGTLEQNSSLARDIETVLRNGLLSTQERTEQAYALFHTTLEKKQLVPQIPVLGRLIQACGRLNQLERVRELYSVAQMLIANVKSKMSETRRRELWVLTEDNMIIALAHAGDVEGAHVHRRRILEYGGSASGSAAPSGDAYGALILHVKDTTDDASNSLMLWNEAVQVGVKPNLYLYNNIISKLSRARKADYALELFHQMRANGIAPSSITYGAVIGACARVGDVVSAEALFQEMVGQTNFKPRVPPFNTMMQVYTTTKPSRERALWFYEEMRKLNVSPTAHTYKLLMDVYGSVEPVDIASMEAVFAQLKADRSVQIQGTHFASLINAYGCVLKDLDKAIAIFDSISSYNGLTPDAVVYESMVNALVANRRTDLIPVFLERMSKDGVHMTAYVANFLIKGYANVGDAEKARAIFESMVDPPTGVAAPNNHAPHDPSDVAAISVMEPVYREPSTWEAMIRAELGAGSRDRAYELLERLRARQYPEAVFNRISGVMVDHSMVMP